MTTPSQNTQSGKGREKEIGCKPESRIPSCVCVRAQRAGTGRWQLLSGRDAGDLHYREATLQKRRHSVQRGAFALYFRVGKGNNRAADYGAGCIDPLRSLRCET